MSLRALIPFTLNEGLMKPQRGFTLVAGKKKLGQGKIRRAIAGFHKMCYFECRKFPTGPRSKIPKRELRAVVGKLSMVSIVF